MQTHCLYLVPCTCLTWWCSARIYYNWNITKALIIIIIVKLCRWVLGDETAAGHACVTYRLGARRPHYYRRHRSVLQQFYITRVSTPRCTHAQHLLRSHRRPRENGAGLVNGPSPHDVDCNTTRATVGRATPAFDEHTHTHTNYYAAAENVHNTKNIPLRCTDN